MTVLDAECSCDKVPELVFDPRVAVSRKGCVLLVAVALVSAECDDVVDFEREFVCVSEIVWVGVNVEEGRRDTVLVDVASLDKEAD